MSITAISPGDVFSTDWSPDPIRVIALDDHVVMYDIWWADRGEWGMVKLSSNYSYYRLHRSYFEQHAKHLRSEPLTEAESRIHRPDLPCAFATHQHLSWYEVWPDELHGEKLSLLDTPSILLAPFGPRNSSKPAVLIYASDGKSFSEQELLLAAKTIQDPYIGPTPLTVGIGLHRLGIQKQTPSYYLWGFQSRLDEPTI